MALGRTLGVPIFQEQVMQIAMLAAGFSAGEADELRRAMAAWRRKGGLGPFHHKVIHGMVARGYTREFAESIFRQIEGFGEYGFPESHAASFALLVYVSCWLKKHHPDAFLVGLLNAQPMGFYAPAQLVEDAKRHGVQVQPVDVCLSEAKTVLENISVHQWAVRLGLHMVSGLSSAGVRNIIQARQTKAFDSCEDLVKRAELNRSDLQALAAADALRSLSKHRHQAQWDVSGLDTHKDLLKESRTQESNVALPSPTIAETVFADYASIGLSLTQHPIALIRHQLPVSGIRSAKELKYYPDKRPARACGLVTHRQRPSTAKGTVFITLEDETGQVNVIVWPELLERQRDILLNSQVMAVFGIWQKQGEVRHLLAKRVLDLSQLFNALKLQARNFQ